MTISCIAIDDEPLALSKITGFIAQVPGLELKASFDNAVDALNWLHENKTDLIFLDIQMDQLTGIQFIETSKTEARIILTTAYDSFALKGYELNVCDYLLKPFSLQRFLQAVEKVFDFYSVKRSSITTHEKNDDFLFVKTEHRHERIDISDIIYIEGMKDYLRIVCTGKKIMTLQSFSRIETQLPMNKFCRVHKSFIVSIDKIKSVERGIISIADRRIPVSNTYKDSFYARIKA